MRRALVLFVVVAAVGFGAACSDEGVREGEARLSVAPGSRVLAAEDGDGLRLVERSRTLHLGSEVKVLAGSASVALPGGARLGLRKGSEVGLGSPISLVADGLLVETGRAPLTIAAAGSQVVVAGAARLSRDLAVSAASYRGRVTLRSAGRSLQVPALRQAAIASLGRLPDGPEPLDYDPDDPWDRRFLGDAIQLGEELEAKSRGFTASLRRGEGRTPGFFKLLLPELDREPQFGAGLVHEDRAPGETLVGAAIVVGGRRGTFLARWEQVFAFRAQDAAWGLVALDQGVSDAEGLVRSVDLAIGRADLAFAPAPSRALRAGSPASGSAGTRAEPSTTPAPSRAPAPAAPSTPPTTAPPRILPGVPPLVPTPSPSPSPPGDGSPLLEGLLDAVTDTVDAVEGLLSPGATQAEAQGLGLP